MGIDASIPLQVRPFQAPDRMNMMAKVLGIQAAQQQMDLQREQAEETRRKREQDNALLAALNAPDADVASVLTKHGRITDAAAYRKSDNEATKAKLDAEKTQLEMNLQKTSHVASMLSQATDQAKYDMARALAKRQFNIDLPEQFDPAYIQASVASGMKLVEKLKADHDRLTREETGRHNLSTEGLTARGQDITMRGQNMVDARSRESAAIARQGVEVQRQAARSEVRETADGFVLVDKGTGTYRPLLGGDGKPLSPKLKEAPPAVQAAVLGNAQNLARAERALALATGQNIGEPAQGGQQGDKNATGWKGYLPNQVLNRVDPKGVDTRAAIADLGSLVIHDRSGAAVTAAEFPRLAPFIPTEKDDAVTVKKKLQRFVQVYREELSAMQGAYNPTTGYRPPAGGAVAPVAAAPGAPNPGQFRVLGVEKP